MNEVKLIDLIDSSNVIDLVYGTNTILDKTTLYHILQRLFGERVFYTYADERATQKLEFKDDLTSWWARRGYHYNRIYEGLRLEYSPIENTDKYETSTDTMTGNDSLSRSNESTSDTESTSNYTGHNTGTNTATTNRKANAYNSSLTNVGEDTTTETPNLTNTTEGTNDTVTTLNETTTEVGTKLNVVEHTLHTHGNIGVTTNTFLLTEEAKLRSMDLEMDIVKEFIDLYTTF